MSRKKIFIVIALLIFILVIFMYSNTYSREVWQLSQTDDSGVPTTQPHETCVCFGTVAVMESFPLQYSCSGIEFCRDISIEG
jgi:hypothetical protein